MSFPTSSSTETSVTSLVNALAAIADNSKTSPGAIMTKEFPEFDELNIRSQLQGFCEMKRESRVTVFYLFFKTRWG